MMVGVGCRLSYLANLMVNNSLIPTRPVLVFQRPEARRADTLIPWMGFMHGGMDRRVWELVALSALAGVGCGLAAVQGDLWFVALFGAVSVVTIVEAIRRLR